MEKATDIIARLGGVAAAATALGVPLTTVSSWCARGKIPVWRMGAINSAIEIIERMKGAKP